jgi:membrane protease YdiL (CAAX protease family)
MFNKVFYWGGRIVVKTNNDNSFLERYTLVIYFVITFLITIILGAAYQFTNNVFISPQYAPTMGLVLICVMSKNWSVWGKMNWNPVKTWKNLLWMLISLFLPVVVILITSLIISSMGNQYVLWKDTMSGYVITIIAAILGCISEEIGWRGYLLPEFVDKHNMFYSTIAVGLLWGAWHCKFAYGIFGFILFVMLIICFSIFMSWIYMKTKGNLLCMILFHFGVNIGSVTLLQNREGVLFYGLATIICVLICIPIVLKNKNEFFNKGFLKTTPIMQNEHNVKLS